MYVYFCKEMFIIKTAFYLVGTNWHDQLIT